MQFSREARPQVMTVRRPGSSTVLASAFCLATVLGGCEESFDPETLDPPVRSAPAEVSGVALTVALDSARIRVTDTVLLLVSNHSDTAVTLDFGSSCQALPELLDAGGADVVPLGGWACLAVLTEMRLPPRGTRETRWPWTYLAGFASGGDGIAPGWYWIGATLSAFEFRLQSEYQSVQVPARIPIVPPGAR